MSPRTMGKAAAIFLAGPGLELGVKQSFIMTMDDEYVPPANHLAIHAYTPHAYWTPIRCT